MNPLNHVAIIMDGNGRWGLKKKNSRNFGHKEGLNTIEKIITESLKYKIKYLTLFVFSTENWKRPKKEIKYLFKLLENFLLKKIDDLNERQIKLKVLGKINFSKRLNKLLRKSEQKTKLNKNLQINLALNYGSHDEIVYAIKDVVKKKISINKTNISQSLFTKNIPDPDMLIRTGNTNRISNFLLWQISYSEIFFVKKLWPDFTPKDYMRIIHRYKKIKRNYGAI